jgi:hypothetical protein
MSMYNSKFVAAVKVEGKVLREQNENDGSVVYLPFKSEYSLLLKNLNSRKAVVKVSIDGTDVLYGNSLIVKPNDSVELERFLKDMNRGEKFLFIEKTKQISDYRGDKVDDGVVRIEYQFEQEVPVITTSLWGNTPPWIVPYRYPTTICYSNTVGGSVNHIDGSTTKFHTDSRSVKPNYMEDHYTPTDNGITVGGSDSNQKFTTGHVGALEPNSYVMTIMLRGENKEQLVEKPLITKMKSKCPTCGSLYRGFPKFCASCGTRMN